MPRGIRYLKARRGHVNSELGLDGVWLPVTRTHTMQDGLQVGLWFHYMRGCSDFALEVGRTLLVRNKCEAAVLIEQRASNVTWASAVAHVHRKLSLAVQHASFGPALYHFIHGRKEPLNESTIWSDSDGQWALDRCARKPTRGQVKVDVRGAFECIAHEQCTGLRNSSNSHGHSS